MSDQQREANKAAEQAQAHDGPARPASGRIWILVDHSSREVAFDAVARELEARGVEPQIVTITEVLGTMAREALAGGAERLLRGLRVATRGRSGADEDLIGAVRRARPDVLAITNSRYVRALGLLENLTGIPSLQVGLLPDYNLSPGWLNSALQAYVVPDESQRQRLVANGIPAERVLVAGPAVQPGFERELDRAALRRELGFGEQFVVLVRADCFDAATLDRLVFQCTLLDREAVGRTPRFVFHHNGDTATAGALRRAADQYGLGASMFGKVADLERFVVAADAVLASSQEPMVAELVAAGRPILFVGIDDNHAAQIEYLSGKGAARAVADVLRLGSELDRFCVPDTIAKMEEAMAGLEGRNGNRQVADALATALANAEAWRVAPVSAPAPEPEGPGGGDTTTPATPEHTPGPFETIGTGGERPAGQATDSTSPGSSTTGSSTTSTTTTGEPIGRREAPAGERPGDGGRARTYAGISQAEAREQLAQLILVERDLERRLGEIERQQQRWRNRLDLAREWKEDDLAREAEGILRGYIDQAEPLQRELGDVQRQKEKLKQAAHEASGRPGGYGGSSGGPTPAGEDRAAELERRFQRMEVDNDLKGLKDRIKRELGE